MYSKELPPFETSKEYAADLKRITVAGQTKDSSAQTIDFLNVLVTSATEHFFKRAYAMWALDQIAGDQHTRSPKEYHVNNQIKAASDTNAGSKENPFKTIQRGAEVARAGDTIIVHGGVYRECVFPICGGISHNRPVIFKAAEGETVVIKASDPIVSKWESVGLGCYATPYTPLAWDAPQPGPDNTPQARCEQVFAHGKLLRHVKTKKLLEQTANTMWINDDAGQIVVHLENDQNPVKAEMERSLRPQCFIPAVRGIEYVHVIGFTMIGGASFQWTGGNWHNIDQMAVLSVDAGRYWLIENNTIEWGNAQGLNLGVGGFATPRLSVPVVHAPLEDLDKPFSEHYKDICGHNTARGNKVRFHGIAGIVAINGTHNLTIENNEVIGSCQKDNEGTCEEAGIKIHWMVDGIIRNNVVSENNAYGIWLDAGCIRNRISGNILVNNANHAIFHEISNGPLLVDNNVIIDNRENRASCGFYTHDGNYATIINNIFIGPKLGVRVRALFHRKWGDGYTTTNHNHFYNNIFDNCEDGCISLMPEVPRCEDNQSDYNIFWMGGKQSYIRVENTSDVGMVWETSAMGKALGFIGGGDKTIPLTAWALHGGKDTHSCEVPPLHILGTYDPVLLREKLIAGWKSVGKDIDGGYCEASPIAIQTWLMALNATFSQVTLVQTFFTGPTTGLSLWNTAKGLTSVRWQGESVSLGSMDVHPLLGKKPSDSVVTIPTLATGETASIKIGKGYSILESVLPAHIQDDMLVIPVGAEVVSGHYMLLMEYKGEIVSAPYFIAPACTFDAISSSRVHGNSINAHVSNNTANIISGCVTVTHNEEVQSKNVELPPHQSTMVSLPVTLQSAAHVKITAQFPTGVLTKEKNMSFAVAHKSDSWENCPLYDIEKFPGGAFPEGIAYNILYLGRLHAGFRVRYSEKGLYVRVEAEHPIHRAFRSDVDGVHCHDGVKIGLKGQSGDRTTVVGMALRSDTGEKFLGFNKTAAEQKFPIGKSDLLEGDIVRSGNNTTYEVLITWEMINRTEAPKPHTTIPFSVLVSKDDGDASYGLQWFFGIKYDQYEGDEAWMGQLWFE